MLDNKKDGIEVIYRESCVCFYYHCKAREYLYFKIYGKQCITPVAIMTSSAKNNHERITSLCERLGWFGRGRSSFQLFEQVLCGKLWGCFLKLLLWKGSFVGFR